MMMKDKGQPMMKYGGGPRMSAELAFMPAVTDMIGGRASSIVNAGARSRMSGQHKWVTKVLLQECTVHYTKFTKVKVVCRCTTNKTERTVQTSAKH